MSKTTNRKTISFGKVAYNNPKRKVNAVEVDIELRELDNGELEFSASGEIWNASHTDIYCGGQCLDTIAKYLGGNALFGEILDLWKTYHLNGMHVGTRRQETELNRRMGENRRCDYGRECEILREAGLYYDKLGEGESVNCESTDRDHYAYGTAWLTWSIPEADLERIKALFN